MPNDLPSWNSINCRACGKSERRIGLDHVTLTAVVTYRGGTQVNLVDLEDKVGNARVVEVELKTWVLEGWVSCGVVVLQPKLCS